MSISYFIIIYCPLNIPQKRDSTTTYYIVLKPAKTWLVYAANAGFAGQQNNVVDEATARSKKK